MSSLLIDKAVSKVQSRVGKFLTLKAILMTLQNHPSLTIQSDATALLSSQTRIEDDLSIANTKITNIKLGTWTYSDLAFLGSLAYHMEDQIKKVGELNNNAIGQASIPNSSLSSNIPFLDIAINNWKYILGGYILLKIIK